jgi:hypothetical protein
MVATGGVALLKLAMLGCFDWLFELFFAMCARLYLLVLENEQSRLKLTMGAGYGRLVTKTEGNVCRGAPKRVVGIKKQVVAVDVLENKQLRSKMAVGAGGCGLWCSRTQYTQ